MPLAQKLLLCVGEDDWLALALRDGLSVLVMDTEPQAVGDCEWLEEGESVGETLAQGEGVRLREGLCVREEHPEGVPEELPVVEAVPHTVTLGEPLVEKDAVSEGVVEGQGEAERETLALGESVVDTLLHGVGVALMLTVVDKEEQGVGL